MKRRPQRVIFCALATVLLLAGPGVAQTTPPTKQVSAGNPASKNPYTTEPIAEIAKLKTAPNTPINTDDLKAIQARVEAVAKFALPAIVDVRVSDGQGSGVIISKDGYVLTAGHVSGAPHQRITLVLSNGTSVTGETLGANDQYDSGLVKITSPGDYAFMPIGSTAKMSAGQWVIAMGHPGGFEPGRPPVVRLGKVLNINKPTPRNPEWYIQSDCPLIMGDSGGPVFDLDGRVVGINSRIGVKSTSNVHVPIDTFVDTWDRLAKGEQWGGGGILAKLGGGNTTPVSPAPKPAATLSLAVSPVPDPTGVLITGIGLDKASERAGVLPQDIITKFNGQVVKTDTDLSTLLSKHAPGETVTLDLLRNAKPIQVKVTLDAKDSK
jgi:serine protease Do